MSRFALLSEMRHTPWLLGILLLALSILSTTTLYANPMQTVTLSVIDSRAQEGDTDTAMFRVTRTPVNALPITVNLSIANQFSTTSIQAHDYILSGPTFSGDNDTGYQIIIPANTAAVDLTLTAIDDRYTEAAGELFLRVEGHQSYSVGNPSLGIVTVAASDTLVTNTNSWGIGSLHQAIENANTFDGPDTITFDLRSDSRTIRLLSELPSITGHTTIALSSTKRITLQRDSSVTWMTILRVAPEAEVTLRNLTMTGGNAVESGGGIWNQGDLTLEHVHITHNTSGTDGGGIRNAGKLTLVHARVTNNQASRFGGAILNTGIITISSSIVQDNRALNNGGGVWSNKTLVVNTSTLNSNQASSGGAIYNTGDSRIHHSAIYSNTASLNGGGIYSSNTLSIINSTLSGNTARQNGSAVYGINTLYVRNSTVANNIADSDTTNGGSGALLYEGGASSGVPQLGNTIIAGNASGVSSEASDIHGNFTSAGFNLIGNINGGNILPANAPGDRTGNVLSPLNPQLGPLQNNGGATLTHALLASSPAVNAGNNQHIATDSDDADKDGVINEGLPFDQRGAGFERVFNGGTVDIGAVEQYAPLVARIQRLDQTPTNAATVQFAVTFTEAVIGVDPSDFRLSTSGTQNQAVISHVTAINDRTFRVTIATVSGATGTINLDVLDDDTIVSSIGALQANIPLGGAGTSNGTSSGNTAQTYAVDRQPPVVVLDALTPVIRASTQYTFTVRYSDDSAVDLTTLGNDDIAVSGPNGFRTYGQLLSMIMDGQDVIAVYRFAAPAGGWQPAVNGVYTLLLRQATVADSLNNAVAGFSLGQLSVQLPTNRIVYLPLLAS